MNRIAKSIVAIFSLLLIACGESGTDPTLLDGDATGATFKMQLVSSAGVQAKLGTYLKENSNGTFSPENASEVTIEAAQANIDEIRLQLPDNVTCDEAGVVISTSVSCEEEMEVESSGEVLESKIKLQGPIVFDLLTGEATPPLDEFNIPSGTYRKVEFRIDDAESGALAGLSFLATGSFEDSMGDTHDFEVRLSFDDEVELENQSGIEVAEDTLNDLVVNWDIEQFFTGLDLQGCVDSGDLTLNGSGELILDDENGDGECQGAAETVRENIKDSLEWEDEDDDS